MLVLFLTLSCSFSDEKYDKLIDPIKKIKIAEKKAGKPNPVYDGLVEPDFPDEDENNKTLEGVDSNHDGVRDDIEIWINRTADDQYVRAAMRDLYKREFDLYKLFSNSTVDERKANLLRVNSLRSRFCLGLVLFPYESTYFEKKIDISNVLDISLNTVIFNSSSRRNLQNRVNSFQFKSHEFDSEEKINYCAQDIPIEYVELTRWKRRSVNGRNHEN
jgi:hypothetical protein